MQNQQDEIEALRAKCALLSASLVQAERENEHHTKPAPSFSGMTDEEVGTMPPDDFADALYARLETKEALLTCEDMDEIEALWERHRRTRRAALALLTKPWAQLNQEVIEDRGFAVAVAQIKTFADEVGLYKGLAELMEAVSVWCMVALAGREDMSEVLEEANALE